MKIKKNKPTNNSAVNFEILYEHKVEFKNETVEKLATKQIMKQIKNLYKRKIYPNVGWEIWTSDCEEFTTTRIIYANGLFQFYLE